MAKKSFKYAMLEALQWEMQRDKDMFYLFEFGNPNASAEGLPDISLEKEFGQFRANHSGLDEYWYIGCALGAGLIGIRAIAEIPSMTTVVPFEMICFHAARLRHMSGGQVTFPTVMIVDESGQGAGSAGQHSCYEVDSYYAHIPGLKVVVPATPYDAKGLMHAAIRDPDPILWINPGGCGRLTEEVPDEAYEVPIGKAAIRTEGEDLTIVSSGNGMPFVLKAVEKLQEEGISVETIDLRSLKPMDTETLVASVQKTGRLLTMDESPYTLCPGAEVIARVAEQVPGVHFTRIAFPDAPPPAGWEMFNYMKPNDTHVYDAAHILLGKGGSGGGVAMKK